MACALWPWLVRSAQRCKWRGKRDGSGSGGGFAGAARGRLQQDRAALLSAPPPGLPVTTCLIVMKVASLESEYAISPAVSNMVTSSNL